MSGKRRRFSQDGDVPPGDFQGSHDAFQQRRLSTSARAQQAVAADESRRALSQNVKIPSCSIL